MAQSDRSPALAGQLGHLLRRVQSASLALGPSAGLPSDRPISDVAVLTAIEAFGPLSQRALADHLGVNPRVMVQIVDRLEASGVVVRERDPEDRRRYALSLTADGRLLTEQLDQAADRHTAALTRNLTADERKRLNGLLLTLLAQSIGLIDLPPKLTDRTGFLVARAHLALRGAGRDELGPLGVEPRHFGALLAIADIGPASQQRIANELDVSGTIVVQLVDYLEAAGLVERRRAPTDRRVQHLTATAAGRRLVPRARPLMDKVTAAFTRPVGKKGASDLVRLLTKLLAS